MQVIGTIGWPRETIPGRWEVVYDPVDGSDPDVVFVCDSAAKRIINARIGEELTVTGADKKRYRFRVRTRRE